jgi:hypothetical protein
VRTVARTAVVAGTATAVAHGVSGRMNKKEQQQAQAQAYEAQAAAQQVPAAAQAAAPAPAPAAATGGDVVAKLEQLVQLHDSGALDDAEFEAAKQKLLAG